METSPVTALPTRSAPEGSLGAENLQLLYEKTLEGVFYFLSWRHKVMLFCYSVTGALVTVSVVIYDRGMHEFAAAPLGFAAMIALVCLGFEKRNQQILDPLYAYGGDLELRLGAHGGGLLATIPRTRGRGAFGSYGGILRRVYPTMALVEVVAAIGILI